MLLVWKTPGLFKQFFSFKELVKRQEIAGYYKRSPILKKQEHAYFKYQKKVMFKFLELINFLSKNLPKNQKIIFRPHPSEREEFWENRIGNLNNVEIAKKGNIASLIQNSKAVIQNGCTSSLEAYISKIPVLNFTPIKSIGHNFGEFAKEFTININTKEKILKFLNKKKYLTLNKNKIVNKRILYLDKELSANKIVNQWELFTKKNFYFSDNKIFLIKFKLILFEIINFYFTNILLILKGKRKLRKFIFHKFLDFNYEEIGQFFNDLKKILKIKKNIKLKKISREFYLISSR